MFEKNFFNKNVWNIYLSINLKQQAHYKLLLTTISFVKNNYIIQKNEKSSTVFHFCKSI